MKKKNLFMLALICYLCGMIDGLVIGRLLDKIPADFIRRRGK